jgi:hypothetical protein
VTLNPHKDHFVVNKEKKKKKKPLLAVALKLMKNGDRPTRECFGLEISNFPNLLFAKTPLLLPNY